MRDQRSPAALSTSSLQPIAWSVARLVPRHSSITVSIWLPFVSARTRTSRVGAYLYQIVRPNGQFWALWVNSPFSTVAMELFEAVENTRLETPIAPAKLSFETVP